MIKDQNYEGINKNKTLIAADMLIGTGLLFYYNPQNRKNAQ